MKCHDLPQYNKSVTIRFLRSHIQTNRQTDRNTITLQRVTAGNHHQIHTLNTLSGSTHQTTLDETVWLVTEHCPGRLTRTSRACGGYFPPAPSTASISKERDRVATAIPKHGPNHCLFSVVGILLLSSSPFVHVTLTGSFLCAKWFSSTDAAKYTRELRHVERQTF